MKRWGLVAHLIKFRKPVVIAFAFIISLAISSIAIILIEQSRYQQKRLAIQNISNSYANLIKTNIYHALSATYPLAVMVRQQNGGVTGFKELATEMLPFYASVASLQLAPQGIVQHIVPLKGNEKAIGHNLFMDPRRNKDAFLAKNTGQLTLAGPLNLVQGKTAIIGRLPIFVKTLTEKNSFWGFSSVLIFLPDLLKTAKLHFLEKNGIAYELFRIHPDTGKKQLIASSEKALIENPQQFIIKVPNAQWYFNVSPIDNWTNHSFLWFEISLGLLFSLLITFSIMLIKRLKDNSQLLEHRTHKLQENETRLTVLIDNAVDAIITINEKGIMQNFNTAAITLFGYSSKEVIGKNIKMLMPNPFKNQHDDFLANYARTGEKKIIGIGREVVGQRKSGEAFPIELGISEITLNNGKRIFTGIIRDITEQKETDFVLRVSLEAAKQANKAKSKFLSSMSHELRTPMNAIIGFSELLASDTENPLTDDQLESVKYISEGGQYLLSLINDVLDLSKIENGHVKVTIEPVDVKLVIFQACHLMQDQAKRCSITIKNTTTDEQTVLIKADQRKLKQVLLNLISNAIKYNREKGTVTLSCVKTTDKKLRIYIHDTGEGVPEELLPRMFTPFDRLGKEKLTIQGTGIGLTICKDLIELMEGEIGVFINSDQGLTFWLEFEEM